MTKVQAIERVLQDNGGIATWNIIYNQLEKYYPQIKASKEWKAGVRGVLYRELDRKFRMIDVGIICLLNYDESKLLLSEDVNQTSKSLLVNIRIGQEKFRKNLLRYFKKCPITGIDDKRLLLASHIKPWAVSSNIERMDIYNGFIFSPTIDKLFDTGLITFEDNRKLIISSLISKENIRRAGLEENKIIKNLQTENRLTYLKYHRENVFISK